MHEVVDVEIIIIIKIKEAGFVSPHCEKLASEAVKRSGMDHTVFTLQLKTVLHHTCLYLVKH